MQTINPQEIEATTTLAFVREGAKVVLVYKKVDRTFDESKTDKNGVDRYYAANAGDTAFVEEKLSELNAEYLVLEKDISREDEVKEIYDEAMNKFGRIDVLVNNAATDFENGNDAIETITQDVIDNAFAVNVRGNLMMTREFVNHC